MSFRIHSLSSCFSFFLMTLVLSILFLATSSPNLLAQKRKSFNRFNAGLIVGLNTSQLNGDHLEGYDKFGFFAGIRAGANFTKKDELVFEIQFTQKGSRNPEQLVPGKDDPRFISLDYIEVPILYHHKFDTKLGGIIGLEGGLAFSKLIGTTVNENAGSVNYDPFSDKVVDFSENDLSLVGGVGIYFNQNFRLTLRSIYSLTLLFESENPIMDQPGEVQNINKLRNILLSAGLNYNF